MSSIWICVKWIAKGLKYWISSRNFGKTNTLTASVVIGDSLPFSFGLIPSSFTYANVDNCPYTCSLLHSLPDDASIAHILVGSHTETISSVAISPSSKAIYHLWDIALFQYERSCINESVLFISDIFCFFAWWYSNRWYCFSVRAHLPCARMILIFCNCVFLAILYLN